MIPFLVSLALYITMDTGNMAIFLFKGLPDRVRVVQTLYFNGFQWVQTVDQWLIGKSLGFFELDKAGFREESVWSSSDVLVTSYGSRLSASSGRNDLLQMRINCLH